MTCYVVTFQTNSEMSRSKVVETLMTYGFYCPVHDYCWVIKTDVGAVEIADKIGAVLQPSERVFVIRSGTEAAWRNSYGEKNNQWLKENL
jgi:hypothetical protein